MRSSFVLLGSKSATCGTIAHWPLQQWDLKNHNLIWRSPNKRRLIETLLFSNLEKPQKLFSVHSSHSVIADALDLENDFKFCSEFEQEHCSCPQVAFDRGSPALGEKIKLVVSLRLSPDIAESLKLWIASGEWEFQGRVCLRGKNCDKFLLPLKFPP